MIWCNDILLQRQEEFSAGQCVYFASMRSAFLAGENGRSGPMMAEVAALVEKDVADADLQALPMQLRSGT